MPDSIKIAVYQGTHGNGVPRDVMENIQRNRPLLLCLPEYFMVKPDELSILPSAERHDTDLGFLKYLSEQLKCAVTGATLLIKSKDGYRNRCYLIAGGKVLGHYDKIHTYGNEGKGRVKPGNEYKVIDLAGVRIGLLICADVLFEWSFANIRGLSPDIIVVPVTSLYREGESVEEKFGRDKSLFLNGARVAGCPVIKVGSVGQVAGRRVQGRSLAADPERFLFRVRPEDEGRPLLKYVELKI